MPFHLTSPSWVYPMQVGECVVVTHTPDERDILGQFASEAEARRFRREFLRSNPNYRPNRA